MINIPFNFQPASVSVKTSSYTIPIGKYAYVSANVEGTGTFTIGGDIALRGTTSSQITNTSSIARSRLGSFPNTSSSSILTTNATPDAGDSASFGYGSATFTESVTSSYWIPAGSVISGSGTWRATVSLYNEIS